MEIDLSSLDSVGAFARAFQDRFSKLGVPVHNAAASLQVREVTAEALERHLAR
jgi:NAD(P)-dependent dehydrogenase (short-subunit alcohol dehydrogenase family)